MTSSEKLKAARERFKAIGINPNIGAPPIVRVFWLVGIPVPPLVFLRFGTVALITGMFFAVFWGFFMWLFFWSGPATSRWVAYGVPIVAGAVFGLYNAWRMRAVAQKLDLPLWAQYNWRPFGAVQVETAQPVTSSAGAPSAAHRRKFTRIASCPYCGGSISLGLLSFFPRIFVGPRVTCQHCHKRCTLRLWLRFTAWLIGFVVGMAMIMGFIALMVVTNLESQVLMYAVIIASVLTWMAVQLFICFRYGVLVKTML